jgi:hypothetical protein
MIETINLIIIKLANILYLNTIVLDELAYIH